MLTLPENDGSEHYYRCMAGFYTHALLVRCLQNDYNDLSMRYAHEALLSTVSGWIEATVYSSPWYIVKNL